MKISLQTKEMTKTLRKLLLKKTSKMDLDGIDEAELKEKESMLMEEVLVLQMKVAALTKQLNDILAQQGMNSLEKVRNRLCR